MMAIKESSVFFYRHGFWYWHKKKGSDLSLMESSGRGSKKEFIMRIFITSNKSGSARVALNTDKNKYGSTVFEAVGDTARVNALAVLNATLTEVKEKEAKGLHVFFAPGVVADAIAQGWFKYWLATGKNSKEEALSEEELTLWAEFAELYSAMFLNVVIKNIKAASLPQNRRFKVTAEQERDSLLQGKAWEILPKASETEEVEDGDIFA